MCSESTSNKLLFQGKSIVMQEVPDEITLAYNIAGCPNKCFECHSKHLWENKGESLIEDLKSHLSEYKYITCVCFMGGEWELENLIECIKFVKNYGLKVCVYTGSSDYTIRNILQKYSNYVKTGPYIKALGGLDDPNTNQRMYKKINNEWHDITWRFQMKNV